MVEDLKDEDHSFTIVPGRSIQSMYLPNIFDVNPTLEDEKEIPKDERNFYK